MASANVALDSALTNDQKVLADWVQLQLGSSGLRSDLMREAELRDQSREFISLFKTAAASGAPFSTVSSEWASLRDFLSGVSRSRALQGFSPSETAAFVLSLKQPLFAEVRNAVKGDASALADGLWTITSVLDKVALYTTEVFLKSREEVIRRQQQELLELSTPVVELWTGILALPLIGTLDSARTQVVMESLLQAIVRTGAAIAIIDITGVPTVDTLVAQHLLKTVAAARLMGADCIISGIRPQIAQTIVHLGVDLSEVSTKATLADAFTLALRKTNSSLTLSASKHTPTATT
jgi:rsbT co-antagonist protein RsbR